MSGASERASERIGEFQNWSKQGKDDALYECPRALTSYQIDEVGVLVTRENKDSDVGLHGNFFVLNLQSESSALVVVVVIGISIVEEMDSLCCVVLHCIVL